MQKDKIIVITGPTATGKTALAAAFAKKHSGEVVSADSMQVYQHMDIGTAKPSADELCGVAHHMIGVVPPWTNYSVACYVKDAVSCIDKIKNRGNLPIIAGGTGLYIDSLLKGRDFKPAGDAKIRKTIEDRYDAIGGEAMLKELSLIDRAGAENLHPNDKKRIVRAFEVIDITAMPLSEHNAIDKSLPPRYDCIKFALSYSNRAVLYDAINNRVDKMIQDGLVNEVASLLEMGVSGECTSMQAIGYKEIVEYLENKVDFDTAVANVKRESTRYAKRQLTWFRRDSKINWILWDDAPDIDRAVAEIERITG